MIPTEFPFSYPIASQVLGSAGLSPHACGRNVLR